MILKELESTNFLLERGRDRDTERQRDRENPSTKGNYLKAGRSVQEMRPSSGFIKIVCPTNAYS